jgi:Subtilase family
VPSRANNVNPRTFFLNETHELASGEKRGGGRAPQYVGIAWAAKAEQITETLHQVVNAVNSSHDPLKNDRYFVVANPVAEVEKLSTDKRKAPEGTYKVPTEFGGQHARVFDRLGLDLLQVTDEGKAVVHASPERMEQLLQRSESLESLGPRERARWVTIESFDTIPLQLRVDADWLKKLKPGGGNDIVIELQPVLSRVEADRVLRAIADLLMAHSSEKLTGTGTDFSGRHWFRGKASLQSVRAIAKDFYSVQAIHPPLFSIAAGKKKRSGATEITRPRKQSDSSIDPHELPCVAVLDLGVPADHIHLKDYRRGQFVPLGAPNPPVGDHGSLVASRVVFGEHDSDNALASSIGQCSFYDAVVADYPIGPNANNRVNDKIVIRGVRGAAPDVRVFNLSFGDYRPLNEFAPVERHEKRLMLQDLDNFVFGTDTIVVVAAGNSRQGVIPSTRYPDHHVDPNWALGPWACGYNTLVCGSFVPRVSAIGLAQRGWPSPFSRVGPGLCGAPVPSFGAEGGNTDDQFRSLPGLGVWCLSDTGLAEDHAGTSFAAPLLAREAAKTLSLLQRYCTPGTQPFAVTARAFLALVARRPTNDARVSELVDRTLGKGLASADRLATPLSRSAVVLWQGYIESPNDIVRVQLPIPRDWLNEAENPVLRLVVCADPPVNETAHSTWACRRIRPVLHPAPDVRALNAPQGGHPSFPCIDRTYRLARYTRGGDKEAEGDSWLIELSYEEIAPYSPGMDFDPRQRVALAAELFDESARQADPQAAMQALPIAASMNRLSTQPTPIRNPVIVRTR